MDAVVRECSLDGVKQGETKSGGMMLARCDAGTAEPRMIGFSNR
jgi:hypothetical protein